LDLQYQKPKFARSNRAGQVSFPKIKLLCEIVMIVEEIANLGLREGVGLVQPKEIL
jgi:hypothetical protein